MKADIEQQVRFFAMTRIGVGASFVLAPGLSLRSWVGREGDTPAGRMAARMVGGRDIALGVGLLMAARHGAPVRGWLEAGAVCDATDFVANMLGVRHVPNKARVVGAGLSAVGAVVFARRLIPEVATTP